MVRRASCALLVLDNTTKNLKRGRKRVGRIYVKLREKGDKKKGNLKRKRNRSKQEETSGCKEQKRLRMSRRNYNKIDEEQKGATAQNKDFRKE